METIQYRFQCNVCGARGTVEASNPNTALQLAQNAHQTVRNSSCTSPEAGVCINQVVSATGFTYFAENLKLEK